LLLIELGTTLLPELATETNREREAVFVGKRSSVEKQTRKFMVIMKKERGLSPQQKGLLL